MRGALWVIVLAGGEGRRLHGLALDARGVPAPKQFCSFGRDRTLLGSALARAEGLVPRERVLVSVTEAHRRWWSAALADRPRGTVVSQPLARGTAVGVLLPLLRVLHADPRACVVLMPSDHAAGDEAILRRSLMGSVTAARARSGQVVLSGLTPDRADPGFGWILPADDWDGESAGVAAFVEKPDTDQAARLMAAGGLWNMFLVAATGAALIGLYHRHLPELVAPFLGAMCRTVDRTRPPSLDVLYERLPTRDVSRDLIAPAIAHLRVIAVPPCGWTDLGTPERLACWQRARRHTSGFAGSVPVGIRG